MLGNNKRKRFCCMDIHGHEAVIKIIFTYRATLLNGLRHLT